MKCTVTNTRDKGSIKVVKDVVGVPGYTDGGRFDLLVDGQVKADEIADGGATPVVEVDHRHAHGRRGRRRRDGASPTTTAASTARRRARRPSPTRRPASCR